MIALKTEIRACSACAGDYEDPEGSAEDQEMDEGEENAGHTARREPGEQVPVREP